MWEGGDLKVGGGEGASLQRLRGGTDSSAGTRMEKNTAGQRVGCRMGKAYNSIEGRAVR